MDQNESKLINMDQNVSKQIKTDQNRSTQIKMVTNGYKRIDKSYIISEKLSCKKGSRNAPLKNMCTS